MKIALIGGEYFPQFPNLGYGGIESCVENLAEGLKKNNQDFFVIVPNHFKNYPFPLSYFKKKYPLPEYDFEILYTQTPAIKVKGKSHEPFVQEAKNILAQKKPEIIWSQSYWSAIELKDLGIPIICTFHDSCLKNPGWMINHPHVFYRFISKFQYQNWVTEDWNYEKSFQLYTGMIDDEYDFGKPENREYFLWVGGFNWDIPKKGLDVFVRLAEMNPEKKFVCYGVGNKKIEKWIKNKALKLKNLDFRGELKRGACHREAFKKAWALIMPTRLPEALGRVNLEALSKGTPVIGFPNGALPELVNENVGFLSNNINELSNALNYKFDFDKVFAYSQVFHISNEIKTLIKQSQHILLHGRLLQH
jgi:glycosyltransferase involved in cell wall biosynthesis